MSDRIRRTDDGTYPEVAEELRKVEERASFGGFDWVRLDPKEMVVLLQCAVRYALGRQSYVVGEVAELVEKYYLKLPKPAMDVILRDLREELARGKLSSIDEPIWRRLAQILEARHG